MFLSWGRVLPEVVVDNVEDRADLEDVEVQAVDAVVAELGNSDIETAVLVDTAAAVQAQEVLPGVDMTHSAYLC